MNTLPDWLADPQFPAASDDIQAGVWIVIEGSTNVAEITYWPEGVGPEGATMGVRFLSGREYHYWGVSHQVFQAVYRGVNRPGADGTQLEDSRGGAVWDYLRRAGYVYRPVGRWK